MFVTRQIAGFARYNENQPYHFPPEVRARIHKGFTLYVPIDVRDEIRLKCLHYQSEPLASLLARYRIDYVLYGPYEKKISKPDFDRYGGFALVYDEDGTEIYQVRQQPSHAE